MNVVLTREAGKNDPLRAWLPEGATVNEVPLTATTYFDRDDVRRAVEELSTYGLCRSLVVTSERSADYVEIALHAATPDVELFAVGPTTKDALSARGVRVHLQGDGSAEALAPHIERGPVLVLGAKVMRDELMSSLRAIGLEVDAIACYETIGVTLDANDIGLLNSADVLFIGAPSAWTVARAYVSSDTWVIVPGASTGSTVRSEHPNVIEGWGPHVMSRLAELSR